MKFSGSNIEQFVNSPSLGAITYQARRLIEELESIDRSTYPIQAIQIRDLFGVIVERAEVELWKLYDPQNPFGVSTLSNQKRVRQLGRVIQRINSYLRYLRASSPQDTPPEIQVAISHLTKIYFPQQNGAPLCLTRPQWKYNLTYMPFTMLLRRIVPLDVFDPNLSMGATTPVELISKLWQQKFGADSQPPEQLAVLSFAKLDTRDTLLFPLLAHELAHFLDFSYPQPLHMSGLLKAKQGVSPDDVNRALGLELGTDNNSVPYADYRSKASALVSVCLRELLADLLATKMMGFSFFVAQSEYLKTLTPWEGRLIQKSGYPSIGLRLHVIFRQLTKPNTKGNIISFFESHKQQHPEISDGILSYLAECRKRVGTIMDVRTVLRGKLRPPAEFRIAEEIVLSALDDIETVANTVIDDQQCARLSDSFFERVLALVDRRVPTVIGESADKFQEALSAGWAYQLLYGEAAEIEHSRLDDQLKVYNDTCRLLLDAIERIPF